MTHDEPVLDGFAELTLQTSDPAGLSAFYREEGQLEGMRAVAD